MEQSDSNVTDSLSEFYDQLLDVWQVQVYGHCIEFSVSVEDSLRTSVHTCGAWCDWWCSEGKR